MNEPFDLKAFAIAGRHRLFTSEDHRPGEKMDPWDYKLRGKHGKAWPYGQDKVSVYTHSSYIKTKLLALPDVEVHQVGDTEAVVNVTAGPSLDAALRLIQPKRKRVVTPDVLERFNRMRAGQTGGQRIPTA